MLSVSIYKSRAYLLHILGHIPLKKELIWSSSWPYIEVLLHLQTYLGFSIYKISKVVFHIPKDWGRLPLGKILRSSSICKNIEDIFRFLPFSKRLRSSTISKKMWVVFHFRSYSTPVWLIGQVLRISSYFTTSPDGWVAARPAGWVLEETKLRLTQPSLVELGLGLSLEIIIRLTRKYYAVKQLSLKLCNTNFIIQILQYVPNCIRPDEDLSNE
jgi:hypothetical protein